MFELADYLVGIYKVHDCTRSVTVQNYYKEQEFGTEKENEKENHDEMTKTQEISVMSKETSHVINSSQELDATSASTQI